MTEENNFELPNELEHPEFWPFGPSWEEKIPDILGWKAIDIACGVHRAGYVIRNYLTYEGQNAFEKVIIQNKIIRDINSGKKDPAKLTWRDIDWQNGNTWEKLIDLTENLFSAFGANRAPQDVLDSLNYQKNFINAGYEHSLKIINYINHKAKVRENDERIQFITRNQENEKRNKERVERMNDARNKWNNIDIDHSKVEFGFIYVLENILMPGVYKIGFTANNPDKRAEQISQQYNLPSPFVVLNYWRTRDPYIIEQRVHKKLSSFRINGEFFNAEIGVIEVAILESITL